MRSSILQLSLRRFSHREFCTGGSTLSYIPYKTKEEILSLHDDDPTRWNATTLSMRFKAPRQNVGALLRLGELRKQRESKLKQLAHDEKERIEKLRKAALEEWNTLTEVSGTGGFGKYRRAMPSRSVGKSMETANATAAGGGLEGGEDSVEMNVKDSEDLEEEEVVLENSAWADHLEECMGEMEHDVKRKTRFAFIEIGERKDVRRAVWIRENSGELRMADAEERKFLQNEVGVRDTLAWKS